MLPEAVLTERSSVPLNDKLRSKVASDLAALPLKTTGEAGGFTRASSGSARAAGEAEVAIVVGIERVRKVDEVSGLATNTETVCADREVAAGVPEIVATGLDCVAACT